MKVKVGIIGGGFGVYGHLPAFDRVKHCQVTSICAPKSGRVLKAWGNRSPGKIYQDWKTMLVAEKPDAIAIAVPPKYQFPIAKYALQHRIAVFAEKPLAISVSNARQLAKLAKEKKLPNMVDFIFPEIPAWIEAKKIVASGKLGKITRAEVTWKFLSYNVKNGISSWKTDPTAGGGPISFFFSHAFYYMECFLGPIEKITGKSKKTNAKLNIIFKSNCMVKALIDIAYAKTPEHSVVFHGQKGTLTLKNTSKNVIDGFTLSLQTKDGKKKIKPTGAFELPYSASDDPRVRAVYALAKKFIGWCKTGKETRPNFQDGLRVQELIAKAKKI